MTATTATTATTDVTALADAIRGTVAVPCDDAYASLATPWNVAMTSTPTVVVEPIDAADVATAVRFAAAHGLEVAVQATGHGATVFTVPTLLIATARLDEVHVDPATSTVRAGAGVRWQQVLDAAAPFGRAGLAGSSPQVGVVGYHTGGGLSPVARTFGYAADHVVAFDVVTGDGAVRRATATEEPELFFALRGGKGAAGIVTAIEFSLVPVATVYAGEVYFDGEHAPTVLREWREWSRELPEQASTSIAIKRLPAMPGVPPQLAGKTTITVRFAWIGDAAEGARVVEPMTQLAQIVLGGFDEIPFTALGSVHKDPVDPMPVHERAALLDDLTDVGIDTLLAHVGPEAETPIVMAELRLLGGAIARTPQHPSAVCHRDAGFTLLVLGVLAPPIAEVVVAHTNALVSAFAARTVGMQPNFQASADPAVVARRYDEATLARLAAAVRTYDPAGVIAAGRSVTQG